MADPPSQGEQIQSPGGAHLQHCGVESVGHSGQLNQTVVTVEQLVRKRAPPGKDLLRQLSAQHPEVGQAFAGGRLRQCVEASDSDGGEREQVTVATAVDHESVAVRRPCIGQRDDGISDIYVPRQTDPDRKRGEGGDVGPGHGGTMPFRQRRSTLPPSRRRHDS